MKLLPCIALRDLIACLGMSTFSGFSFILPLCLALCIIHVLNNDDYSRNRVVFLFNFIPNYGFLLAFLNYDKL